MDDKEIVAYSGLLRDEASELLNTEGLLPMLKAYGTTRVIGSYTLDTMTWPADLPPVFFCNDCT